MRRASRVIAEWASNCPASPSFFISRQLPAAQHQPATQHHVLERPFSSGSKSDLWPQPLVAPTATGDLRTLVVGQPSHHTHPELLSAGELTPGILAVEYAARRRHLMECLPQGAAVVLPSASIMYMSGVIPYPYRQDPDFFYLTGLMQRGVLLLQSDTRKAGGHSFTLFIDGPNPERARWDGATVEADAAIQEFGADYVYSMTQLPSILSAAARKASEVFFDVDRTGGHHHGAVQRVLQAALPPATTAAPRAMAQQGTQTAPAGTTSTSEASHATQRLIPLRQLLHAMRLRKSSSEIALMRASAQLAATALTRCIQQTRPGVAEYSLAATFEYECKLRGASRMAYPQVVAAGSDATTIHYGRNDKVLRAGQLLLMDAGCELHGYCSDVTRTWPVSGRFSSPQRDVYDLVLSVHARCVAACRPGSTLRELHQLSCDLVSEGLHSLGVCRGATLGEIQCGLYRRFYWHSVGHWLGLDTHDTPLMAHERVLQPGHVITIEPGVYIPDEDKYGALRGIGVRIEDDVLVTPTGCEVLSAGVPHRREEVEALVGSAWK